MEAPAFPSISWDIERYPVRGNRAWPADRESCRIQIVDAFVVTLYQNVIALAASATASEAFRLLLVAFQVPDSGLAVRTLGGLTKWEKR